MGRRILLALCLLVLSAAAVEPIYRVDTDVLFVPSDGLALDAHTGHVVWRYPRYEGQTYTNGHGLLLVAWVSGIQTAIHHRYIRVCRLRTSDGKSLWCRDWPDVEQWTVDAAGKSWYIREPGRLQVLSLADGRPNAAFGFDGASDADLTLMPLPNRGAMVLDREANFARAFTYEPGAASLRLVLLPATIYPFRGNGRGLLLYTRESGEFFFAAPFTALLRHTGAALAHLPVPSPFPKVKLDDRGFVFTDWQGSEPVLRGGNYAGTVWQVPRVANDPELALSRSSAILLQYDSGPSTSTELRAWDRNSGEKRFQATLPGVFPAMQCFDDDLIVQSDTEVRLLDATTGAERWRFDGHEGPMAAIANSAVVFWEQGGELAAIARNNGHLLWRIRFKPL